VDFDDTPQEAAFRQRARTWLSGVVPSIWGGGEQSHDLQARLARAKRYQALKAEAGFVAIAWPRENGGQGLAQICTTAHRRIARAISFPRYAVRKSGASSSPSLRVVPMSPPPERALYNRRTVIGSSTAKRRGPPARTIPTSASLSHAQIHVVRSTRDSPCSFST
jgi:hypothetical protein